MRAPAQPQLPAIGSIFPSVAAFKLACHRAALAGGFEIKATSANTRFASMQCRLRTLSTATNIRSGTGEGCSLSLHACAEPAGMIKVTKACYRHSCSSELQQQRSAVGAEWTRGRIERLEDEIAGRRDPLKRKRKATRESSSSEWSVADEGSSDSANVEASDDEEQKEKEEKRTEPTLPSAWDVRDEVAQLRSSGSVPLPSPAESFSSARDLLIRLHAHAQQRSFTIYRRSAPNASKLFLVCWRYNSRFKNVGNGCCKYSITAHKKGGTWRVTDTNLEHNHSLDDNAGAEAVRRAQGRGKGRKAVLEASNEDDGDSSSSFELSPAPPVKRKAARALVAQRVNLLPPSPASQLFSLLCALLPDTPIADLDRAATLLFSLGISSVTSLAELVLVADDTLLRWIDHLGSGGAHEDEASGMQVCRFAPVPEEACTGLLSVFEAMRAAFEEEE
ncbi:hypothetical protein JCM10207_007499 [Rhodosporidiobolus poonsookiae]